VRFVAPASTANLGPGFDAAAAALDLWNELVVEEGSFAVEIEGEGADELPRDASHLALRAFAQFAPVDRHRFTFVNRIPLERGLGSSAAAIAVGLVAGAAVAGRDVDRGELLALGARWEGHSDNLAAALYGGVCLTWQRNGRPLAARVADTLPAALVVAVPQERTNTAAARNGLPFTVKHDDAAVTAGAAALLGAAIASGDVDLLGAAFADRIHEQYRAANAPLFGALRERPPDGTVGVTLSGSGPTVVVWARHERVADVQRELEASLGNATVLPLAVAQEGVHET
jgi:homoserine kinase